MPNQRATAPDATAPDAAASTAKGPQRPKRSESAKSGPVWLRPERPPRPRAVNRAEIVAAAIDLADADGLEALSLRKVAARLGIHVTSLYWYIDTKDDLLDLMGDALMGRQAHQPSPRAPWRDLLAELARSTYRVYREHPWLAQVQGRPGSMIGPDHLRHFEQSLACIADLNLDHESAVTVLVTLDDFVIGHALQRVARNQDDARLYGEQEQQARAAYMRDALDSGRYPHLADYRDDLGILIPDRFEAGLAIVLAGIAAYLDAR